MTCRAHKQVVVPRLCKRWCSLQLLLTSLFYLLRVQSKNLIYRIEPLWAFSFFLHVSRTALFLKETTIGLVQAYCKVPGRVLDCYRDSEREQGEEIIERLVTILLLKGFELATLIPSNKITQFFGGVISDVIAPNWKS